MLKFTLLPSLQSTDLQNRLPNKHGTTTHQEISEYPRSPSSAPRNYCRCISLHGPLMLDRSNVFLTSPNDLLRTKLGRHFHVSLPHSSSKLSFCSPVMLVHFLFAALKWHAFSMDTFHSLFVDSTRGVSDSLISECLITYIELHKPRFLSL